MLNSPMHILQPLLKLPQTILIFFPVTISSYISKATNEATPAQEDNAAHKKLCPHQKTLMNTTVFNTHVLKATNNW